MTEDLEELIPIELGHTDVEEHQVNRVLLQVAHCFNGVGTFTHQLEHGHVGDIPLDHGTRGWLVIHHQATYGIRLVHIAPVWPACFLLGG